MPKQGTEGFAHKARTLEGANNGLQNSAAAASVVQSLHSWEGLKSWHAAWRSCNNFIMFLVTLCHFGLCADSFLHLQEAWTRSKMVFQRHHALADHFHLELGALPDIVDTIYVHIVYYSILFYIYCISMYIVLISFLQYITTSVISAETSIHDACGQNISNCSSARARSLLRHFSFSACQGARMKRTCSPQQLRHRLLRCQLLQG